MAIISISRGTLSGGHAIAELVARQLRYPCVSREAITNSADWYGIPMDAPAAARESPSYWERLAVERTAYLDSFRIALFNRARRGNLVYHGHVGHLLLSGIPMLRVRVVADMEHRVQVVMHEQGLAREEATAYIDRVDRERREWVNFLYGVEWDDPALYDVVLNLSHLSLDGACSTVVHLARLGEFKPTAKSLKAMEDLILRDQISAVLARDKSTAGTHLEVRADGGVVTIVGTAHQAVLDHLPALIATVDGVRNTRYMVRVADEGTPQA